MESSKYVVRALGQARWAEADTLEAARNAKKQAEAAGLQNVVIEDPLGRVVTMGSTIE